MRRFGAAAVLLYLAAMTFALRLGPVDVRPLYDGVDIATYAWINPPRAFAAGNVLPLSGQVTAGGGDAVTLTTDDTQASLDFGPDGVADDGRLHATITPVDPATLGAVAPGQTPVGNAYLVEVTIDGAKVVDLARRKTLRMRQPTPGATTIYQSPDGNAWTKLTSSVVAGHVIASTDRIGFYVITGPTGFVPGLPPPRAARAGHATRNVVVVVVGSLIVLTAAGWDTVRRRRARSRANQPRAARRRQQRKAKRR
ncbi:MAG: hypothetical protein ABI912_12310 [Actinomycetota bacterium]